MGEGFDLRQDERDVGFSLLGRHAAGNREHVLATGTLAASESGLEAGLGLGAGLRLHGELGLPHRLAVNLALLLELALERGDPADGGVIEPELGAQPRGLRTLLARRGHPEVPNRPPTCEPGQEREDQHGDQEPPPHRAEASTIERA